MAFNVLIVDNSPAMRRFVRRVLELSGLAIGKCLEAGNGKEALELLRQEWLDVVLTDIHMPTMNGEQFVRLLEEDESLRSIPVLVVSTDRTEHRLRQMLALGAKGYVTKPFLPETLRKELGKVLGVAQPASEPDQVLADSVAEVLETMFFTGLTRDAEPAEPCVAPWISASLSFHGNPSGKVGVRAPLETGRKIAASFLGLEEGLPSESQTGEVLCELANMICGSVLSRLEGDLRFELSPPEINAAEAGCQENHTACRVLGLEEGPFAVWLDLEQAS